MWRASFKRTKFYKAQNLELVDTQAVSTQYVRSKPENGALRHENERVELH